MGVINQQTEVGGLPLRVQPSGVDKRPSLRWEYVWTCHIIFSSGWMYVCTQLHIRSHKIMLCVYIYIYMYIYMCVWYRHVLYALYNQDGICVTFMYDAYHTHIYIYTVTLLYIYNMYIIHICMVTLMSMCIVFSWIEYIYIMVYITINIYIYIYMYVYTYDM